MRWVPLLGFACACNQWFGIDRTQLVDGPPAVDAAPPPTCPVPGSGDVPRFDIALTPIPARKCSWYVPTPSGTAIATCVDDQSVTSLATGSIDDVLTPQLLAPTPTYLYGMRPMPEGDAAFVTSYNYSTYQYETAEYRKGDPAWTLIGTPFATPTMPGYYHEVSTPTRGPVRRVLVVMYDAASVQQLAEFDYSASGWVEVRRTPIADLGVTSVTSMSMSPDGLRLVFVGTAVVSGGGSGTLFQDGSSSTGDKLADYPVYYADRATQNDPFSTPKPLDTVPDAVSAPYLTEDCGRIYFGGLSTVWYLKQALP